MKKKIGHVDRRAGTFVYANGDGDIYEVDRASGGKKKKTKDTKRKKSTSTGRTKTKAKTKKR